MKSLRTLVLLFLLLKIGVSQGLVEKIVYSSDQSGTYDIWMMNPDGSDQIQLTSDSQNDYEPKISPDGTKIVFLRTVNSGTNDKELHIMDIDGQNDYLVIDNVYTFSTWWPDGTKLIYKFSDGSCNSDAYTINLDGTGNALFIAPEQLVVGDNEVYGIEFSESGDEVIWASQVGCWSPTLEIFKANMVDSEIDASSVVQLTNDGLFDNIGDWSVENGKIVYWHCQGGNGYDLDLFEIYTMDSNGDNKTRLSDNSFMDIDSRFSPDGEKIIFVTIEGEYNKIASMNIDGSNIEITNSASCNERYPEWGLVRLNLLVVNIPATKGPVNSSIFIPIQTSLNPDSLYRATELNFSGYPAGLEFIGIDTVSTMIGGLDWTWAENEVDGVLQTAFAGSDEITGDGVFCYLEFLVTGDICTTVPVNCDYALFNDVEVTDISNGAVYIEPIPAFGDADGNGLIQALDASDILMYLVDSLDLDCQAWTNANVYLDTVVDAMDASIILQSVVDSIDSLPVLPDEPAFLASGTLGMEAVEAINGADLLVPLILEEGAHIFSYQGEFTYNPDHMTFVEVENAFDGFVDVKTTDDGNGHVKFATYRSQDSGPAEGVFAQLRFTDVQLATGTETGLTFESFKLNGNLNLDIGTLSIVSTESEVEIPSQYTLKQNYPNPFNPTTTISYGLPETSEVSIIIYDVSGREVMNLVQSHQAAGWYDVNWNGASNTGNRVSTGLYFARITAGSYNDVIKMVYLR